MLTNMLLQNYPTTTDQLNSHTTTDNFLLYSTDSSHFDYYGGLPSLQYPGGGPMIKHEDVSPPMGSPSSEELPGPSVVGKLKMPSNPLKFKLCEVCGNAGATSHYGGTVCGGCKIFFSRTVQSRKGFVCERGGQCPMNAGKRAKCRACRFQLCLKAHMSPEEVGRLRDMRMGDYGNNVKKEGCVVGYFDEASQPSTSLQDCAAQIISFVDVFNYGDNEIAVLDLMVNIERNFDNNGLNRDSAGFPKFFDASFDMMSAIEFPIPICARIPMDYLRKLFLEDPKTNMKLFWCRNVHHFLEWANANEDLNHFSRQEKTLLIAENFISIACLTNFYGFLRIQREQFELAEDGTLPPPCHPDWFSEFSKLSAEARTSVRRAISEIMEPMDSLDLSIEEMVLLKFIMLFNEPSTSRTSHDHEDVYRIRCYRLKYCELLRKYIKKHIPDPDKRISRISDLLKIVESVKNLSMYLDRWMTMFYASNTCQMNDVLVYDFHVRTWHDVSYFDATWKNSTTPRATATENGNMMMPFCDIKREI